MARQSKKGKVDIMGNQMGSQNTLSSPQQGTIAGDTPAATSEMAVPQVEELRKIYSALGDNVSKDIYAHRLLYSLLGRKESMTKIIYDYNPDSALWRSEKICFYGAGRGANWLVSANANIRFVVDKHKTGVIEGIPIISLDTFLQLPDCKEYLLICTQGDDLLPEIEAELDALGLQHLSAYHDIHLRYFNELQYFDLPQLGLEKRGEYFVDAGALDGETSKNFFRHCEEGHAYVFEPNPQQFGVVREELQPYGDRVELFPAALYDENTTLFFDINHIDKSNSMISETGEIKVQARRMDDVLAGRKVTFIKMDIEGAELAALRGAEQIIREQRPKLAICIYHKPEDMWEIPSLILQYRPDYKLYLRHYSITWSETVLYAI